jgi:2-oxoisovalerate dehydrogenase E2 component (dihydrolipoyl transacylase)
MNVVSPQTGAFAATLWDDADIETWWMPDADVMVRLVSAIARACAAVPIFNARFDAARLSAEPLAAIDLGIAIDVRHAMIVPVLSDVGRTPLTELRRQLTGLKTVASAGPHAPSITLANIGHIAGRHAALPVSPPQVATIAAGRVTLHAVQAGRRVAFHHMLPLSVSFDTRAATVGDAARFLAAMLADLGRPDLPLSRGIVEAPRR